MSSNKGYAIAICSIVNEPVPVHKLFALVYSKRSKKKKKKRESKALETYRKMTVILCLTNTIAVIIINRSYGEWENKEW